MNELDLDVILTFDNLVVNIANGVIGMGSGLEDIIDRMGDINYNPESRYASTISAIVDKNWFAQLYRVADALKSKTGVVVSDESVDKLGYARNLIRVYNFFFRDYNNTFTYIISTVMENDYLNGEMKMTIDNNIDALKIKNRYFQDFTAKTKTAMMSMLINNTINSITNNSFINNVIQTAYPGLGNIINLDSNIMTAFDNIIGENSEFDLFTTTLAVCLYRCQNINSYIELKINQQ